MPLIKRNKSKYLNNIKLRNRTIQKKLTIFIMILISGFIITWTPYALVSMYSAFIRPNSVNGLYSILPALFAKSSMIWLPAFYLFTNVQIKSKTVFKNISLF